MIAHIDLYRDQFGVGLICRTLGATRRGFLISRCHRATKFRSASGRELGDRVLLSEIERVHAENYGVYGTRKLRYAMPREG